jgi:hypothetical protein
MQSDPTMQKELFEVSTTLLNALVRRYPDLSSHIMYVFTSNYPPCDEIASKVHTVNVQPPSAANKRDWCVRRVADVVFETFGLDESKLKVSVDVVPTSTLEDMVRNSPSTHSFSPLLNPFSC